VPHELSGQSLRAGGWIKGFSEDGLGRSTNGGLLNRPARAKTTLVCVSCTHELHARTHAAASTAMFVCVCAMPSFSAKTHARARGFFLHTRSYPLHLLVCPTIPLLSVQWCVGVFTVCCECYEWYNYLH
jgi:hypothetical protein